MNVYLLVEGRSTEKKVYPALIDYFLEGKLKRVVEFDKVIENNYFLLSGNGYPRIFDEVLKDSIQDINSTKNYDYLIICIDADENTIEQRQNELSEYLEGFKNEGIELDNHCQLELIVQNRCIETWFLGNKKIYKSNPTNSRLVDFQQFYNVQDDDPELMPVHTNFDNHANFHFAYLREMLLERNVRYTKKNPRHVSDTAYIEQLVARTEQDNHINSFAHLIDIFETIKKVIDKGI